MIYKNSISEIYDLVEDEKETTDVSLQHPELILEFEQILKKEHRPSHIREWEFVDPKFTAKD